MSRTKIKPKRLADFPKPYRDALAHWFALRSLGFAADDIFCGFGAVSGVPDILYLELRAQGNTFVMMCSQIHGATQSKVFKTWKQIADMANDAPPEDRDACYRGHLIGSNTDYFATFIQAMQAKGILAPEILQRAAVGQA